MNAERKGRRFPPTSRSSDVRATAVGRRRAPSRARPDVSTSTGASRTRASRGRGRAPSLPARARSTRASARATGPAPSAADDPLDLLAMQQQLPGAERVVAALLALLVRRDVHLLEPEPRRLADRAYASATDARPCRERLHLGTGQDDAGLEPLLDVVVVSCPAVAGDGLLGVPLGFGLIAPIRRGSGASRSCRRSPRSRSRRSGSTARSPAHRGSGSAGRIGSRRAAGR